MEAITVESDKQKRLAEELAELIATDENVREVMKFAGSSKTRTTDEELHQIREKVFWEHGKKQGWIKEVPQEFLK